MKKLILPLMLSILCDQAFAQTDTAAAPHRQSLVLGVNAREGAFAKVLTEGDSTNKPSPVVITTQRKKITILTEPRNWTSTADSMADRLKDIRTERRNKFTYWSGIDVGVNTLLGPDNSTDLDATADFMTIDHAKSRFLSINFMEQKIEFGSHHVGLLTGLGWEFVNYRLKNNNLLTYNADSIYGIPVQEPDFRKNKLRQMGLRVPLMLEFNTKRAPMPTEEDLNAMRSDTTGTIARGFEHSRRHNFHIAMGVVGSWYFDTMYKQKYQLDGDTEKDRSKGDYLLLPYRAAASVRIGYGGLNLFAEYSLTPLFKDGKGPELTPFTVGLTLIGFN